jgi:hypothetical protein
MTDVEQDEITPRERGLLIGHDWARATYQACRPDGVLELGYDDEGEPLPDPVVEAAQEPPRIPTRTRDQIMNAGMRERLDESEDPDAEGAFWAGFCHGVRAYLVEVQVGSSN